MRLSGRGVRCVRGRAREVFSGLDFAILPRGEGAGRDRAPMDRAKLRCLRADRWAWLTARRRIDRSSRAGRGAELDVIRAKPIISGHRDALKTPP